VLNHCDLTFLAWKLEIVENHYISPNLLPYERLLRHNKLKSFGKKILRRDIPEVGAPAKVKERV